MRLITEVVVLSFLLSISAAAAEARTPAKLVGKVFFTSEDLKDRSPEALIREFERKAPKAEAKREKNGHWRVTLVAFFKKGSVPGPMTIWFYDKADKEALKAKEPIQAQSVDSKPTEIFVHEMDIDPDLGYNRDHSYLVQVGQIISKQEKYYAAGELALLK
jgi:hypothetical protein